MKCNQKVKPNINTITVKRLYNYNREIFPHEYYDGLSPEMIDIKVRRHGPEIWMALHIKGDTWMDTYNDAPIRASDYI